MSAKATRPSSGFLGSIIFSPAVGLGNLSMTRAGRVGNDPSGLRAPLRLCTHCCWRFPALHRHQCRECVQEVA